MSHEFYVVIGDVIIDEYCHGRPLGLSAETPTVVAELEKEEIFVGGAGLVARHMCALGKKVRLFSVRGPGDNLYRDFWSSTDLDESSKELFSDCSISHPDWIISRKKRMFVGDYKLLQYDVLNKGQWDEHLEFSFFLNNLESSFDHKKCNGIIICDNRHGVMTEKFAGWIRSKSAEYGKKLYVDSQVSQRESNHQWYAGADYIFMNERELMSYLGVYSSFDDDMLYAAEQKLGHVILKRGSLGSSEIVGGRVVRSEASDVQAVDVCGAGDAFLAAYVASGHDMSAANTWAGKSVMLKGTLVPRRKNG